MPRPKIPTDLDQHHAHILNLGLGVQSTATALMCINGDLPRPDAFITADTGWEREGTYENLLRMKAYAKEAGIPFHVVSGGNIRKSQLSAELGKTRMPFFVDPSRWATVEGKRELLIKDVRKRFFKDKKLDEIQPSLFAMELDDMLEVALIDFDKKVEEGIITDGWIEMDVTMLARQCTEEFKIKPINKFCRKHYDAHHKTPVGTWLGISTDEWHRMSKSHTKAFVLYYPLMDYRLSRTDCEQYLIDCDYPVPVKSSCIGCPFHSNELWQEMTDAEIADAAEFEREINEMIATHPNLKDRPYYANGVKLHASMENIDTRPFDKKTDTAKDMFGQDGVCGEAGCYL